MQMKEENQNKKYHNLKQSVENNFSSILEDEEKVRIFGKPKAVHKKNINPLPAPYTDVDLMFDKSAKMLQIQQTLKSSLSNMKWDATEIEKQIKEISNKLK